MWYLWAESQCTTSMISEEGCLEEMETGAYTHWRFNTSDLQLLNLKVLICNSVCIEIYP